MVNQLYVDHTTMHEMNLALILNTLRLYAPISRAGLAVRTGLNKATVSNMVRNLLASGLVQELGVDTTSSDVGRPAINLALHPEAGYIISAEIGVDFISVIVANFALEIVARRYTSTLDLLAGPDAQTAMLDCAIDLIRQTHQQIASRQRPIFGLAVGVPGLVDMSSGVLLYAPNLDWREVPLRAMLEAEFELPVVVANEANIAALGESYFGAGQHAGSLIYVSSGVGLGGGIVFDDQLLNGVAGFAGEIGHMTIMPDGLPCSCGNVGCWETLATQRALFRFVREALEAGQSSLLHAATGGDLSRLTIALVVEAAQKGDAVATGALEQVGRWLGVGIASLINAINPHCVVFGGPLSIAHEFVLPAINDEVARRSLTWSQAGVEIALAAHAADAAVMGGVAMIHQAVIRAPMRHMT